MKKYIILLALFIIMIQNSEASTLVSFKQEINYLQTKFTEKIGNNVKIEKKYQTFVSQQSAAMFLDINKNDQGQKQFFLFIDRNPQKQLIFILAFNKGVIYFIGTDKVSTGNFKRRGHYVTPTGVFTNSINILGYRALGTKNDKGWMGLGIKNSRIWDLGWQNITKNGKQRLIRLQMHATDPVYGEILLGKISSKGCVRISGKLNYFLDHFGIIDKEYEDNSHLKRVAWLMKTDRQTVFHSGKYIIIGDSEKFTKHL